MITNENIVLEITISIQRFREKYKNEPYVLVLGWKAFVCLWQVLDMGSSVSLWEDPVLKFQDIPVRVEPFCSPDTIYCGGPND